MTKRQTTSGGPTMFSALMAGQPDDPFERKRPDKPPVKVKG
jgi:hypothetical protein